jgi:hypothetical protein
LTGVNPSTSSGQNRAHKKTARQERPNEAEKVTRPLTQGEVCGYRKNKNLPFINRKRKPVLVIKLSHHLFAEAENQTTPLYTLVF